MSKIYLTISGIYPKLIESPAVPHLKRHLHAFDTDTITSAELEGVLKRNTDQIIEEQREVGIKRIADGLIRWEDFYSPFAKAWGGLRRGTLKRIFNTNTLQRRPLAEKEIVYQASTALCDAVYASTKLQNNERLKATLPGPFSFAEDCDDEYYRDFEHLLLAVARALSAEMQACERAGIKYVELYDPYLHFKEYDKDLLRQTYICLFNGIYDLEVILGSFYGTPLSANIDVLADTGLTGFSLDLIVNPESVSWLTKSSPKIIQLGILDARTTAFDDLRDAKVRLAQVQESYPQAEIWLSLNNSPEFLPRDRALEKMQRLPELLN